ncbi:glycosyltransferase family 2 protein [Kribbella sandramycini]|uniref:CDP-glycerol glycerophosphotransferase n=1 Tax=Kribbella sandramycini TaxID=60450 RepID=A0A7Y4L631_9ACTN|nr:glycosyltransferase family 2 protein [Kribbella sandramycini]MBB6566043.1 CDP-glycerol glycerophosphotransferase [Kribbella sandramycini]NOL45044.1 glycosyltransferase family 2 protein [Kribbella sandramycini]
MHAPDHRYRSSYISRRPPVTPRLSVVVPFYNVGEYIGDCLDSIARQTWTDFEAILVDDGSPDDSAVIAKEFCIQDSRFRIVQQDNAGLGPARNTGVRHASGEYLTFVDSDDLVTRHGFEKLIRSLDRTGSDFAGGNARRFNNSSGVRPSWLHRQPFMRDRFATHVTEVTDLVLDRMVWNKVYRRSFWEERGYEFPAIRYEDYPVTLQAHLDAVTVDTIAAPVYYWRERESGESITQQKFQLGNLRDRVISAGMVMDLAEKALPAVRSRLHAHFTQIDLLTLMMAFGAVPAGEEEQLVELASELLTRLDPAALQRAHRYDRIQHAALRAGDVDLLRRLAIFREDGGLRGGARVLPRRRKVYDFNYPGLLEGVVPQDLYRVAEQDLTLATSVRSVTWADGKLSVQGTAEVRHLQTCTSSSLRIDLVIAGVPYPLQVRRFDATDLHGENSRVGFEVVLDEELLGRCTAGPAHFDVRMKLGRLRRQDKLRGQGPGSPGWPPGAWLGESWIQPGPGKDGCFAIRRLHDPSRLTAIEHTPDALVLHGRSSFDEPSLFVTRPVAGGEEKVPIKVDGRDFTAWLPIRPILDETNPDDPFSQRTTRAFRLRGPAGEEKLLLWTAGDRAISHAERGRVITMTRSTGGYVNLHESPIRFAATSVVAAGNKLVARGPDWGDVTFAWRRFLPESDDHIDVPCRRSFSDDGWSAAADLDALTAVGDRVSERRVSVDPLASLADWILFAIAPDGSAHAVQCEPFLCSRLPLVVESSAHTLAVRPHAGTLHAEVR